MDEYTAGDLTQLAADQGFGKVSERLLDEWVLAGLLAHATKRGLGRGKGSKATWSEAQKGLFLTLMRQRAAGARPSALANIPVSIWLTWGDKWATREQVRRCLLTWGNRARGTGLKASAKVALSALEGMAHPRVAKQDLRALAELVGEVSYRDSLQIDPGSPLVTRVFDPSGTGLNAVAAEAWLGLIEGRLMVLKRLREDAISDELLDRARVRYQSVHPSARTASREEFNVLVNAACNELTVQLSFELDRARAAEDLIAIK